MQRLVGVALILLIGCTVVDEGRPAGQAGQATPAPRHQVGDRVALEDGSTVQVFNVGPVADDDDWPPDPGHSYVAADVEGCAGSPSPFGSVNPFDFGLVMADNTRLAPGFPVATPRLDAIAQVAGDCNRGFVTFEVPEAATPVAVTFSTIGVAVRWAIPSAAG